VNYWGKLNYNAHMFLLLEKLEDGEDMQIIQGGKTHSGSWRYLLYLAINATQGELKQLLELIDFSCCEASVMAAWLY
jgi:hypothetical protein